MELVNVGCVITGAAKGLGAALARSLHTKGVRLMLSDIDSVELEPLATELGAHAMVCDITKRDDVSKLAATGLERLGGIDIWINNAGIWTPYIPTAQMDFDRARTLMEVNYFGLAYGTIEAMNRMVEHKSGTIINILSVRSLEGKALAAAYSASKFAAEGFTQAVRDELKETGVRVISVYPHRMKTALFGDFKHPDYDASMDPAFVADKVVENLAQETPATHLEILGYDNVRAKIA